jgi:23S rRNA pseudouridine955/2504/2580 synthase
LKEIIVDNEKGNIKLTAFLKQNFKDMPVSAIHKAIRERDIKVNGKRVKGDYTVLPGDLLQIYIPDNILYGLPRSAPIPENYPYSNCNGNSNSNSSTNPGVPLGNGFSIVYEDSNIMIINKEQGIAVHPDRQQNTPTIIDSVKHYLKQKGEYTGSGSSFAPSLCHRLDRNTGGLIIIAKNSASLKIILDKFRTNEIKKYYQCLVKGKMEENNKTLRAFLEKDSNKSRVFIHNEYKPGTVEIITKYRVLSCKNDISKLEIELVTGRTHQIRAHLAYIGHPVLGDRKYGLNSCNRAMKVKKQALWAYKIVFSFKTGGHLLQYLSGKNFEIEPKWEVEQWK